MGKEGNQTLLLHFLLDYITDFHRGHGMYGFTTEYPNRATFRTKIAPLLAQQYPLLPFADTASVPDCAYEIINTYLTTRNANIQNRFLSLGPEEHATLLHQLQHSEHGWHYLDVQKRLDMAEKENQILEKIKQFSTDIGIRADRLNQTLDSMFFKLDAMHETLERTDRNLSRISNTPRQKLS